MLVHEIIMLITSRRSPSPTTAPTCPSGSPATPPSRSILVRALRSLMDTVDKQPKTCYTNRQTNSISMVSLPYHSHCEFALSIHVEVMHLIDHSQRLFLACYLVPRRANDPCRAEVRVGDVVRERERERQSKRERERLDEGQESA